MILVGNSRGGSTNLASHLLSPENEHVQVHEVRGFASEDLHEAMKEAYAISRGTKCRKFLFSLSLNPPPEEQVSTETFEDAIERVETKLGLNGQPRAVVFHEKENEQGQPRRHAHAVWSRINTDEMKAVQLSFSQKKLRDISRELYIEQGWKMPRGFLNPEEKNPMNYTHAEWQQAKRVGKNARVIKETFQNAWSISDSKAAFVSALEERGYKVARGDRRGFVAVDVHGEVYSIARMANVKTKQVRERLGDEETLRSVDETKDLIAKAVLPKLQSFESELKDKRRADIEETKARKAELVERQRTERNHLHKHQQTRQLHETKTRQARFRKGLGGLWDRLRGEHKRIATRNEREAQTALTRDKAERDRLIFKQMGQRKAFTTQRLEKRTDYIEKRQSLRSDIKSYEQMRSPPDPTRDAKQAFMDQRRSLREQWSKVQDPPRKTNGPKPGR